MIAIMWGAVAIAMVAAFVAPVAGFHHPETTL